MDILNQHDKKSDQDRSRSRSPKSCTESRSRTRKMGKIRSESRSEEQKCEMGKMEMKRQESSSSSRSNFLATFLEKEKLSVKHLMYDENIEHDKNIEVVKEAPEEIFNSFRKVGKEVNGVTTAQKSKTHDRDEDMFVMMSKDISEVTKSDKSKRENNDSRVVDRDVGHADEVKKFIKVEPPEQADQDPQVEPSVRDTNTGEAPGGYKKAEPGVPAIKSEPLDNTAHQNEANISRASTIRASLSPPAPPPSSGSRCLIVKNLPPEATEENLFHLFQQFGPTAGLRVNCSIRTSMNT